MKELTLMLLVAGMLKTPVAEAVFIPLGPLHAGVPYVFRIGDAAAGTAVMLQAVVRNRLELEETVTVPAGSSVELAFTIPSRASRVILVLDLTFALFSNTTGTGNVANGNNALFDNTTGGGNTATGAFALHNNTTGSSNTALGVGAGTGITTADNVIAIGAPAANVSNSCFIGNIRGVQTANPDAIPALIDSSGQLGTASSSRRYKTDIRPMDKASEKILALKPVTFHYKSDDTNKPEFGLIAEEVAEVNPDLVVCDKNGEIYTVRYDAVNAMLLNEFLKEHKTVQELKKEIAAFRATVEEQDSKVQRIGNQLELNKPWPQLVDKSSPPAAVSRCR